MANYQLKNMRSYLEADGFLGCTPCLVVLFQAYLDLKSSFETTTRPSHDHKEEEEELSFKSDTICL